MDKKEKAEMIRLLRADEIECRVSTVSEKGLSLLLFKDARVDQKILDETFTPFGWRRTHQSIDGNLYCTVEVWDQGKEQWIGKQDVGTMSYSEKEKGQASDYFKRACFNWGIGRELYTAPFIWIPASKTSIQQRGDRYVTQDRFAVRRIAYNKQREISALEIVNGKNQKVFELRDSQREAKEAENGGLTDSHRKALESELDRTGVALGTVLERYHIQSLEQMTQEIYVNALNSLKKTRTKEAAAA
ncbi:MAG: hypothetical protein SOZ59_04265 [Candidatus Limivivens sp.]|nr:hypothetical protein [Candidatus Limivivens sp.]